MCAASDDSPAAGQASWRVPRRAAGQPRLYLRSPPTHVPPGQGVRNICCTFMLFHISYGCGWLCLLCLQCLLCLLCLHFCAAQGACLLCSVHPAQTQTAPQMFYSMLLEDTLRGRSAHIPACFVALPKSVVCCSPFSAEAPQTAAVIVTDSLNHSHRQPQSQSQTASGRVTDSLRQSHRQPQSESQTASVIVTDSIMVPDSTI